LKGPNTTLSPSESTTPSAAATSTPTSSPSAAPKAPTPDSPAPKPKTTAPVQKLQPGDVPLLPTIPGLSPVLSQILAGVGG